MAFKFLLGMAIAAVGGIYLTSEEGKKTREAIQKKRSIFDPIIKDLLKDISNLLEDSDKVSIPKLRNNIRQLTLEAKKVLSEIDLEKTVDTVKIAIKAASKKINEAQNNIPVKKAKNSKTLKKPKATRGASKAKK